MTLSDVADLTLLSWDTVKTITKTHLAKDYGKPALRGVRYLGPGQCVEPPKYDQTHAGHRRCTGAWPDKQPDHGQDQGDQSATP
jgi:hypothetical protein